MRVGFVDGIADYKKTKTPTDAEHDESVFALGVVWVKELDSILIQEHARGFFKRDAVLSFVLGRLSIVPGESSFNHTYIILPIAL